MFDMSADDFRVMVLEVVEGIYVPFTLRMGQTQKRIEAINHLSAS